MVANATYQQHYLLYFDKSKNWQVSKDIASTTLLQWSESENSDIEADTTVIIEPSNAENHKALKILDDIDLCDTMETDNVLDVTNNETSIVDGEIWEGVDDVDIQDDFHYSNDEYMSNSPTIMSPSSPTTSTFKSIILCFYHSLECGLLSTKFLTTV
uniref:Uncharacterized protein n=1 Tax=Amphimedon queenslandica TaxID=400682 RepID=A0A1X7U6U9_AMPQE